MIVIRLTGGLGNQMFQYAFIKSLANDLNTDFLLDDVSFQDNNSTKNKLLYYASKLGTPLYNFFSKHSNFFNTEFIFFPEQFIFDHYQPHVHYALDCFDIDKKSINHEKLSKVLPEVKKNIFDDSFLENAKHPLVINQNELKLPSYFKGVFDFESYFLHNADLIRKDFEFNEPMDSKNSEIAEDIKNNNSVAIHFRRGDYLTSPIHSLCSWDYYHKAIEYMVSHVENPKFYIFSNDFDWVKENIKLPYPVYYVNINSEEKGFEDLRLMSFCKHFIVANSSFSWWGAWLSKNSEKIVIKPKPFIISQFTEMSSMDIKNDIFMKNDYSSYFNNSRNILFKLNKDNLNKILCKNKNTKITSEDKLITFTSLEKNSKLFFNNLCKSNNDNVVILKILFTSNNTDVLKIYYLTEEEPVIYRSNHSFPIYFDANEKIESYIPINPNILLNSFILSPSEKKGTKINLQSFEFREVNINSFKEI